MGIKPNDGRTFLVMIILALPSCINVSSSVRANFDALKPGMTSSQVAATIGSPDRTVGELTTIHAQDVVVWEYDKFSSPGMKDDIYWVYLVDGYYLKYTLQGNWGEERELIYRTEYPRLRGKND
jgi:hypothetical protein